MPSAGAPAALAVVLRRDVDELRALTGPDRVRTVHTSGGEGASPLCRARLAAGLTMTQLAIKVGRRTVDGLPVGERRAHAGTGDVASAGAALRLDPSLRDMLLAANPARRSDGVRPAGLGELRRDRGLTQRRFRTALGIGATAVISWELGRVRVPVHRLDDVAGVLGVDRRPCSDSVRRPLEERTGERPLADLRRAGGLTQRELALHLGVHRPDGGALGGRHSTGAAGCGATAGPAPAPAAVQHPGGGRLAAGAGAEPAHVAAR